MIATTIEQSKHLLELGLSKETADMWWTNLEWIAENGSSMMLESTGTWRLETSLYSINSDIPAWSLSALLEVMPPFIKGHHLKIEKTSITNMWYLDYQYLTDSEPRKDLLTAAYEMACWLLDQGLIKKGGQDE